MTFPDNLTGLTIWRSNGRFQASLRTVDSGEGWRVEHGATPEEALRAVLAPAPGVLIVPPCPVPA